MGLARELAAIDVGVIHSPWAGHEAVRCWAVMSLPFESGHVLASRHIPQSDFGPYSTLWLRQPDGTWSLHVDAPRIEIACPRYWGQAAEESAFASIDLKWMGPNTAKMTVDEPPQFGDFVLPSAPLFAVGEAHVEVPDREEYDRLRSLVGADRR